MGYDFDRITDRRNTGAVKWDVGESELPMWVADMDFMTAPAILEAVRKRAEHGIWGYASVPEAWYEAYIDWWRRRHGLVLKREWLSFCTAVVPAVSSVLRAISEPGDRVVVQSPVYNAFYHCIEDNGRQVLEARMTYDGGSYAVDWADLEEKLADRRTTVMILCNPHNPMGTVWDRETLARIGRLCSAGHVTVIADEIHCDVTDPGVDYTPFASVSEQCRDNCVMCIAPTKAFNVAGLKSAAVAVPSEALRGRVRRAIQTDGIGDAGAFSVDAAVAAFTRCEPWLEEMRRYVYDNKRMVRRFLETELPQVLAVPSRATYLLWLDCSALPGDKRGLARFIRERTGLYLNAGEMYGSGGEDFLRMNLGCPRKLAEDGLARLKAGVLAWEQEH